MSTQQTKPCTLLSSLDSVRTGSGQPARWCLHKRQTSPQPYPPQNRGNGPSRCSALCHLPSAACVSRLRLQNPLPVPGDRLHQARSHRRQQAQGEIQTADHVWKTWWWRKRHLNKCSVCFSIFQKWDGEIYDFKSLMAYVATRALQCEKM